MKKVLLVQPILSHYRESLFELLVNDSDIDFKIIAGNKLNKVKVFKSKSERIETSLKNYTFNIRSHKFYYQKGIFKAIRKYKPTNIILGGPDFHFISTIILSFYIIFFTKTKLHFWTHGYSKSSSKIKFKITQYFYSKAASIFTYEEDGKREIISKMKIDTNKIIIVKNCLNDCDYGFNKVIEENKKDTSKLNIIFSGRLTKQKRVDILIKAVEKLIKEKIAVKCIIIGDGVMKVELEELASNLNIKGVVEFKGALYDKDVEVYFRSSDIFVLPGKVGLSIVHALSFGLPIITTSLPIHSPEAAILKQGENAFYFNGEYSEELVKTLLDYNNRIKKNNIDLKDNCLNSIKKNGYMPKAMKKEFIKGIN